VDANQTAPAPQEVPAEAPIEAASATPAKTADAQAFDRWTWSTAQRAEAPDAKVTTLAACTGVPYDYVAADLDAATQAAQDLVMARCFKVLPTTAALFSDAAFTAGQQINLPLYARVENNLTALSAAQGGTQSFAWNEFQNVAKLAAVTGYTITENTDGAMPIGSAAITNHSTELQQALPESADERSMIAAFQPRSSKQEQNKDQTSAHQANDEELFFNIDYALAGREGYDVSNSLVALFGQDFARSVGAKIRQIMPKYSGTDPRLTDEALGIVRHEILADPKALTVLLADPDPFVRKAANQVLSLTQARTYTDGAVQYLQSLAQDVDDDPQALQIIETQQMGGSLGPLSIHADDLHRLVVSGKLPETVMLTLYGRRVDAPTIDRLSLTTLLSVGRDLNPEQRASLFSIIHVGQGVPSQYDVETQWSSEAVQGEINTLTDAIFQDPAYRENLALKNILSDIGDDEILMGLYQGFGGSAPDSRHQAVGDEAGATPEERARRDDIALSQTLDLQQRAKDRGMDPAELRQAERESDWQSQSLAGLYAADGTLVPLDDMGKIWLENALHDLADDTVTDDAKSRIRGAVTNVLEIMGLPADTDPGQVMGLLTDEHWQRFNASVNAVLDPTSDLDPVKDAGALELSNWLGRRFPESAQSIAQGEHWYDGALATVSKLEKDYKLSTRAIGTVGLIFSALGLAGAAGGTAASGAISVTGVGAAAGVVGLTLSALLATASIDIAWASATQIVTGEEQIPLSDEAIYALAAKLGIPKETIDLAEMGIGILGVGALGAAGARMLLRQLKKGGPALNKAGAWALRQASKGGQNLQAGGRGLLTQLQEQQRALGMEAWKVGETAGRSWVTRPGWMLNMRPVEIRKPPDPALWSDGAKPPTAPARLLQTHRADDLNREAEKAGGLGPWMPGTKAHTIEVPAGTRVFMVINEWQQDAFRSGKKPLGKWATPYNVPDNQFPRTKLAIIPQFKSDVDWVVALHTKRPITIRVGDVGPQVQDNITYPGGGRQWNFLDDNFAEHLEMIGNSIKIKKGIENE
jgi:hypothetical protein